jgi:ABC-type phosphate transport system substrate-binding protein
VSGNINTGGSSTVYPLSVAIVENFKKDGFKGEVNVDLIGSGAGIHALLPRRVRRGQRQPRHDPARS